MQPASGGGQPPARFPPPGYDRKPVTYVSLADARAYCSAYGKRLPRAWEWQLAAQGTDGRAYPWGNEDDNTASGSRYPPEVKGRVLPGPADVDAHPQGDSPYGVSDLVGNVWQYTDEVADAHTRFAIVRGGCNYRPAEGEWTSQWYFPQAKRLDEHNKYFLMGAIAHRRRYRMRVPACNCAPCQVAAPSTLAALLTYVNAPSVNAAISGDSYERAGTLGFRCVMDVAGVAAGDALAEVRPV